jgi:hypothetical protein
LNRIMSKMFQKRLYSVLDALSPS